jgi:hypothetical protein
MKKIILSATLLSLLVLASCGKSAVCECIDTASAAQKEMMEAKGDQAKITAIEEKYKGDMETCQKLGEGKTEEEQKALAEEAKACEKK